MVHIKNNPELSTLFRSDELKKFFSKLLEELEDPHVLKSFLKNGCEHLYHEQIKQLSKSFIPISYENQGITEIGEAFHEIERCIDGARFKIGDLVKDLVAPNTIPLVIGRMYEDDRGLHIRLDYALENKLTWRDLSTIDQVTTLIENRVWWIEEKKPVIYRGNIYHPTSITKVGENQYRVVLTNSKLNNGQSFEVVSELTNFIPVEEVVAD